MLTDARLAAIRARLEAATEDSPSAEIAHFRLNMLHANIPGDLRDLLAHAEALAAENARQGVLIARLRAALALIAEDPYGWMPGGLAAHCRRALEGE